MNPFKDFLEKNAWILNSHSDTKVITTHTLGEWALKKAQWYKEQAIKNDSLKYYKSPGGGFELLTICGVYRDIAFECLGEEEASKRLKELNK